MKALVYTGPEALVFRDVADPARAADDVLLTVRSVGICGSDIHAYLGHDDRRPAPLILGHEVAGLGDDGVRYTVNPLVTCGDCAGCRSGADNLCRSRQIISMPPREGGFAEQLAMPRANLVAVPDALSDDQAALAEPLACGWHATRIGLRLLGGHAPRALVLGGGAIGLGAALSLQTQGADAVAIVEPNASRRAFLTERCGQRAIAPDAPATQEEVDIVIDGVGIAATRAQASAVVRPGGAIIHIGLGSGEGGLDIRRMTLQEIAFVGTYTYTAQDFRDTVEAMVAGRLGALDWGEPRPLAEGADSFADVVAGRVSAPKIILKP